MTTTELRDLIVTVAAGISAVGIPTLIALIWRLHEKQVEALKLFTFKEVEAQIAAMESTYTRVNARLRAYVEEVEKQRYDLPKEEVERRLENLKRATDKLHDMAFVVGDSPNRDVLRTMFARSNERAMKDAHGLLQQLTEYESHLKNQLALSVGIDKHGE